MRYLKTLYLTLIMLFAVSILIFVILDNNIINYEVHYVDSFSENTIDIYVLDDNDNIVSITMDFEKLDYIEVFKIYNDKMNSIKLGYHSPLMSYSNCIDITLDNNYNKLFIKLDRISEEVDVDKLLQCLLNTFSYFNVSEIELTSGKSKFVINRLY